MKSDNVPDVPDVPLSVERCDLHKRTIPTIDENNFRAPI